MNKSQLQIAGYKEFNTLPKQVFGGQFENRRDKLVKLWFITPIKDPEGGNLSLFSNQSTIIGTLLL